MKEQIILLINLLRENQEKNWEDATDEEVKEEFKSIEKFLAQTLNQSK